MAGVTPNWNPNEQWDFPKGELTVIERRKIIEKVVEITVTSWTEQGHTLVPSISFHFDLSKTSSKLCGTTCKMVLARIQFRLNFNLITFQTPSRLIPDTFQTPYRNSPDLPNTSMQFRICIFYVDLVLINQDNKKLNSCKCHLASWATKLTLDFTKIKMKTYTWNSSLALLSPTCAFLL